MTAAESEARFTRPRFDCPHPEWWHSTDDDSTEVEVTELVAAFVRALQPEYVVETGAAFGQTTRAIGEALRANGHGELDSLEVDLVRFEHARDLCRDLPHVTVLHRHSLDFEPRQPIGLAWFDSLFNLRVPEFLSYRQWLKPGAVAAFHDTGPQHPLRPQVEELVDAGLIRPIFLPTPRGVCFAEVL